MPTFNLVTAERPIVVAHTRRHFDVVAHRHDNVELVVITAGGGEHVTRDGAWSVARGDVFVIPVGVEHSYRRSAGLALINIGYDLARSGLPESRLIRLPGYHALAHLEPRLRARHEFASHLRLSGAQLDAVLDLIDRLEGELAARAPGHDLAATAALTQILIACARSYAAADTPSAQALMRLAEVLGWLDANCTRPVRLDALARRAGMSKSTLGRLFRRCLDRSPVDHVLDLRLRHACERLAGDEPIADVARSAGFRDANYFARLFRARYGCSPRVWRARLQSA
ncbi:MAG: helix-turn-helix transcriptional regulator [Planctomycetes bacterium]|nr:helix-turn-helix transcriptional regulator [Planctomycetota bacterium]